MAYSIDARLKDGQPCLQILDSDTHAVRLAWTYPKPPQDLEPYPSQAVASTALHELFRQLIVLSWAEKFTLDAARHLHGVPDTDAPQPAETLKHD